MLLQTFFEKGKFKQMFLLGFLDDLLLFSFSLFRYLGVCIKIFSHIQINLRYFDSV